MAIAAIFVFWFFNSCSLETQDTKNLLVDKPTLYCIISNNGHSFNTFTMTAEWLVGGSKNDNLSCLHDAFVTLIQNIQSTKQVKFLSLIQQKISNKLKNRVQTNIVFRYNTNKLTWLCFTRETSLSCPYLTELSSHKFNTHSELRYI